MRSFRAPGPGTKSASRAGFSAPSNDAGVLDVGGRVGGAPSCVDRGPPWTDRGQDVRLALGFFFSLRLAERHPTLPSGGLVSL